MQGRPSLKDKEQYEPSEFMGLSCPAEQAMATLIRERLSVVRNQKNICISSNLQPKKNPNQPMLIRVFCTLFPDLENLRSSAAGVGVVWIVSPVSVSIQIVIDHL